MPDGDVVYLQAKYFDENGILTSELNPDLKFNIVSDKHILSVGDILFAAKGYKNFAVAYKNNYPPSVASTSFFVIRLKTNNILPEYVAWYLNNSTIKKYLKGKAIGTSIASIAKPVLEDLEIYIPDLQKQKTIIKIDSLQKNEQSLANRIQKLKGQLIQNKLYKSLENM